MLEIPPNTEIGVKMAPAFILKYEVKGDDREGRVHQEESHRWLHPAKAGVEGDGGHPAGIG